MDPLGLIRADDNVRNGCSIRQNEDRIVTAGLGLFLADTLWKGVSIELGQRSSKRTISVVEKHATIEVSRNLNWCRRKLSALGSWESGDEGLGESQGAQAGHE